VLAVVEGQLGEERTAHETAESQLQIAREELGGARNALLERDTSIRQLQKDDDAARAALETKKMRTEVMSHSPAPLVFCEVLSRLDICCHVAELQKSSVNPSDETWVLQVAYDKAQGQLKNLETTTLDVCHELEGAKVSPLVARWRAACGPWEGCSPSACRAPFVSASKIPWS
jgi:hypothetical protein